MFVIIFSDNKWLTTMTTNHNHDHNKWQPCNNNNSRTTPCDETMTPRCDDDTTTTTHHPWTAPIAMSTQHDHPLMVMSAQHEHPPMAMSAQHKQHQQRWAPNTPPCQWHQGSSTTPHQQRRAPTTHQWPGPQWQPHDDMMTIVRCDNEILIGVITVDILTMHNAGPRFFLCIVRFMQDEICHKLWLFVTSAKKCHASKYTIMYQD